MGKKSMVFTFGRFQPPTIGHEKLIDAVISHAEKIGAEHRIYASQTFDGNRPRADISNPLKYEAKINFLRRMFPKANIIGTKIDENIETFIKVLHQLEKEGYTKVHMIVGGDRVAGIQNTVDKYLNGEDEKTAIHFDEFEVVSAGDRDPDAEGVEGMSASKLRAAAGDNNLKLFKKGLPPKFPETKALFDLIRKGLERPMKSEKKSQKSKVHEELLNEVTPPDEKSERFVQKAKDSFKDRYGNDWASYLYGVAWKQFNKRHNKSVEENTSNKEDVIGESIDFGTNGYEIQADPSPKSDKILLYKLSYSQGSVRFPDGRKGTVIGRFDTKEEAKAAAKKDAIKSGALKEVNMGGTLSDESIALDGVLINEKYYRKADEYEPIYIPMKWVYEDFFKRLKRPTALFNQLKAEEALEYIFGMSLNPKSKYGKMSSHGELMIAAEAEYRNRMGFMEETAISEATDDRTQVAKAVKAFMNKEDRISGSVSVSSSSGKGAWITAHVKGGEISNDFRKTIMGIVNPGATPANAEDINYGNIGTRLIALPINDWKKVMELNEETANGIRFVKKMDGGRKSIYSFNHSYYVVSSSSVARETAIFRANGADGEVTNMSDLWSSREPMSHDKAIEEYLGYKNKGAKVMKEETLNEGGVKAALEDWLYDLPAKVVQELKSKFGKELKKSGMVGSLAINDNIRGQIRQLLINNKVKPLLGDKNHAEGTSAIIMSFDTYHGDVNESTQRHAGLLNKVFTKMGAKPTINEVTIPDHATVVSNNPQKKTVTLTWHDSDDDKWETAEVPADEVPGFYTNAGKPLQARKSDRFGNIMKPVKKSGDIAKTMAANEKGAQELVDLFNQKPMRTPITIFGKKWGKADDYEMVVLRREYMGSEVYVVKSSGRFVELRVGVSGLQIVDVKTNRILLDKGNDAIW